MAAAKMLLLIEGSLPTNSVQLLDGDATLAKLIAIADAYLIGLENFHAIGWVESREEMLAFLEAANCLKSKLASSSSALRLFLSTDGLRGIHHDAAVAPLSRFIGDLDMMIERGEAVVGAQMHPDTAQERHARSPLDLHMTSRPGPKEKQHISRATMQIARLVQDLSGKELRGTFTLAAGSGGKKEFAEEGPQFILDLLHILDEHVEAATVRTALRAFVKDAKAQKSTAQ